MNGAHQVLIDVAEQLAQFQRDLDQFDVRIASLERGKRGAELEPLIAAIESRVRLLEQVADVPVRRPGLRGRATAAAALRREGQSYGAIAVRLKIPKSTIARWCDELGVETPPRVRSIDGRMVRTDLAAAWRESRNGRPQA